MLYKARTWSIKVTKEIIDRAQRHNQKHCLMAEAVREGIPNVWSVRVSAESVFFNLGGSHLGPDPNDPLEATRFHYPFPARVAHTAAIFDDKGKNGFKPFKFQLDARTATSGPVLWRGKIDKPYQKRKTHKKSNTQRRCSVRRHAGLAVITGKTKLETT